MNGCQRAGSTRAPRIGEMAVLIYRLVPSLRVRCGNERIQTMQKAKEGSGGEDKKAYEKSDMNYWQQMTGSSAEAKGFD